MTTPVMGSALAHWIVGRQNACAIRGHIDPINMPRRPSDVTCLKCIKKFGD